LQFWLNKHKNTIFNCATDLWGVLNFFRIYLMFSPSSYFVWVSPRPSNFQEDVFSVINRNIYKYFSLYAYYLKTTTRCRAWIRPHVPYVLRWDDAKFTHIYIHTLNILLMVLTISELIINAIPSGWPDFSWHNIPKREKIYLITTKLPNDNKKYKMTVIYSKCT
jgi:hypothetical protein